MRSSGAFENNYLYRGEQVDPNIGMQYLRARYYDQNTGRFASTDPFEGWQEVPTSLHRYVYGYNNPLMYVDPSGAVGELSSTGTAVSGVIRGILQNIGQGLIRVITSRAFGLTAAAGVLANQYRNGVQWTGELPWRERLAIPGIVLRLLGLPPVGLVFGAGGTATMTTTGAVLLPGESGTGSISADYLIITAGARIAKGAGLPLNNGGARFSLSVRTTGANPDLLTPVFALGDFVIGGAGSIPQANRGGVGALLMGQGLGFAVFNQPRTSVAPNVILEARFDSFLGVSVRTGDTRINRANPLPSSD